jgi:hypothetical protein
MPRLAGGGKGGTGDGANTRRHPGESPAKAGVHA